MASGKSPVDTSASADDRAFEMLDRDVELGGGIIAGAFAYRLFIWMLPLALVPVAGLGMAADASSTSPTGAVRSPGPARLVSGSVAAAAKSSSRWYGLLVGIPILLWATPSVLRALIGAHRLVWTDLVASAPRPTAAATARLLGPAFCILLLSAAVGAGRSWSLAAGALSSLIVAVPYAGVRLLTSTGLRHRDVHWRALIPGAVLFGVGAGLLQIGAAHALGPMALSKQGTYGALGVAAALLLGLLPLGKAVVAAAELNGTRAERRARAAGRLEPGSVRGEAGE